MPAYSFQKQFVAPVESGDKTHTIRGKRKARPRVGQRFFGYYAMRTKHCRKLIESVITRVEDILIEEAGRESVYRDGDWRISVIPRMTVEGEQLAADEMETLARRDGFSDLFEMMSFWWGRLPFSGDIIHWRNPKDDVK